jgi:hypothetical protein
MNRSALIFLLILLSITACKSTDVKTDSDFYLKDDSVNLYAFIGEKISVTEFDPNKNNIIGIRIDTVTGDTIRRVRYVMDEAFKCRYKVVKNIFNDLKTETVEFEAYDHYGRPPFEEYEHVILYLSFNKERSNYYHRKYQFDPVRKTQDGRWEGLNGESLSKLIKSKRKALN